MDTLKSKLAMQEKMPNFLRQDGHKRKKLKSKWRKPKGIHSKMREKRRGYRVVVNTGYGTPAALRHTNKQGKKEYLIKSQQDLKTIPSGSIIILSAGLGLKTIIEIGKEAKKHNCTIANIDIEKITKQMELKRELQKQKKESKQTKKKKSLESSIEKEKKQETTDEPVDEEEKKKLEKEEKDKLLIKRS